MTMHTQKNSVSGKGTFSFYGDDDTGLHSSTANTMELRVGGKDLQVSYSGTDLYLKPVSGHLYINSDTDSKQLRINSRNFTQTSGSSMGFQSKPTQSVASTGSVIGCEISARSNSGIAVANLIGGHIDTYLKGTAAGTISGDVRGLQIELTTDDAGTRTVSGNVSGIRIRSAFSATTITGNFVPIRIEFPEVQTNSQNYDAVLELTGTVAGVWNDDPATELTLTNSKGYIKVLVNGAARYIALFEVGSLAD